LSERWVLAPNAGTGMVAQVCRSAIDGMSDEV